MVAKRTGPAAVASAVAGHEVSVAAATRAALQSGRELGVVVMIAVLRVVIVVG